MGRENKSWEGKSRSRPKSKEVAALQEEKLCLRLAGGVRGGW